MFYYVHQQLFQKCLHVMIIKDRPNSFIEPTYFPNLLAAFLSFFLLMKSWSLSSLGALQAANFLFLLAAAWLYFLTYLYTR